MSDNIYNRFLPKTGERLEEVRVNLEVQCKKCGAQATWREENEIPWKAENHVQALCEHREWKILKMF